MLCYNIQFEVGWDNLKTHEIIKEQIIEENR